jgi:putative ABC transport system permease protein
VIGLTELPAGTLEAPPFGVHAVSPSFFATVDLRMVQGRTLADEAAGPAGAEPVVVNQAFARAFLGPEPWLGRRFDRSVGSDGIRPMEIVGVSADVVTGPGEAPLPALYVSTADVPIFKELLVRLDRSAPTAATISAIHDAVLELDPGQPVNVSSWMIEELGRPGARTRFQAWLMTTFGALALALAAVGVYGVAAYGASQRRAELGLRRALGARRSRIVALVLARALGTSLLGIAAGLLGAALVSRLLRGLLFEISPVEPVVYAAGAAGLGLVALLAGLAPALRAARDDGTLATLLRQG